MCILLVLLITGWIGIGRAEPTPLYFSASNEHNEWVNVLTFGVHPYQLSMNGSLHYNAAYRRLDLDGQLNTLVANPSETVLNSSKAGWTIRRWEMRLMRGECDRNQTIAYATQELFVGGPEAVEPVALTAEALDIGCGTTVYFESVHSIVETYRDMDNFTLASGSWVFWPAYKDNIRGPGNMACLAYRTYCNCDNGECTPTPPDSDTIILEVFPIVLVGAVIVCSMSLYFLIQYDGIRCLRNQADGESDIVQRHQQFISPSMDSHEGESSSVGLSDDELPLVTIDSSLSE